MKPYQGSGRIIRFDVDSSVLDVTKFLKMYVNYKRASDGIHLYFNYYNYVNTPYIEIRNNKVYPVVLPETYLHLRPGQNGSLSFVTQFKYVQSGNIMGCTNVTLAKYGVYNVSDDKPKFLVKLLKTVTKGEGSLANGAVQLEVAADDVSVKTTGSARFYMVVSMVAFGGDMEAGYSVGVEYPAGLANFVAGDVTPGVAVVEKSEGYVEFKVTDPAVTFIRFGMDRKSGVKAGRYLIAPSVVGNAFGKNGKLAAVTYEYGTLEFYDS